MKRSLSYLMPVLVLGVVFCFLAVQCFLSIAMARQQLNAAISLRGEGKEFQGEMHLSSALSAVYGAIATTYTMMMLMCTAGFSIAGTFIRKLWVLEDRISKLESDRQTSKDAAH